ncbi:putative endonuclease [uncultured Gammaproteobacteria bacterium]
MTDRERTAARTWFRGLYAEALARFALRLKGYGIIASRCRTPAGEIDIVARRGGVLAVVEVKARPTLDAARAALSERQRQRLTRAAGVFLALHPELAGLTIRFDVVLVVPGHWPRHIEDAWRA